MFHKGRQTVYTFIYVASRMHHSHFNYPLRAAVIGICTSYIAGMREGGIELYQGDRDAQVKLRLAG